MKSEKSALVRETSNNLFDLTDQAPQSRSTPWSIHDADGVTLIATTATEHAKTQYMYCRQTTCSDFFLDAIVRAGVLRPSAFTANVYKSTPTYSVHLYTLFAPVGNG
jgi:hypothetical protein